MAKANLPPHRFTAHPACVSIPDEATDRRNCCYDCVNTVVLGTPKTVFKYNLPFIFDGSYSALVVVKKKHVL